MSLNNNTKVFLALKGIQSIIRGESFRFDCQVLKNDSVSSPSPGLDLTNLELLEIFFPANNPQGKVVIDNSEAGPIVVSGAEFGSFSFLLSSEESESLHVGAIDYEARFTFDDGSVFIAQVKNGLNVIDRLVKAE